MKKIILLLLSIIITTVNVPAYANLTTEIVEDSLISNLPISYGGYLFEFMGKQYFYSPQTGRTLEADTDAFKFFVIDNENSNYYSADYIDAGEYYMARWHKSDSVGQSWQGMYEKFPVRLYDKKFNLIASYSFDTYIYDIVYDNDTYYCHYSQHVDDNWYMSTDFENWTKCKAPPEIIEINELYYNDTDNSLSFDGRTYYPVNYEENPPQIRQSFGGYTFGRVMASNGNADYIDIITLDGVYYLKFNLPELNDRGTSFVYSNDGKIFFEGAYYGGKRQRYSIAINDISVALNNYADVPYIIYNNTVLAFEQPPVIKDGNTLVPIRFLFEQIGANVEWEQSTQTATISQNNTTISFDINNPVARVNGKNATMNIPAQLINGKTMVPVRFLSEELGYTVNWDGDKRIITIE